MNYYQLNKYLRTVQTVLPHTFTWFLLALDTCVIFCLFSVCPWKTLSETSLTFKSMTEDVLQNGNKVNELWRRVIYCFKTGAIQQSLH